MKVLYFDCSSGISGNMTLGALSELIDDPHYLVNELKKLNVDGYHIHISKEKKNGITGTYVDVHLEHEHHHEHHHHADEVFTSWGAETPRKFTDEEIDAALTALDGGSYGAILRAKGIVPAVDGGWIHFDYVPFEHNVRRGSPEVTGRLCVIGAELKEDEVSALFHI